MMPGRREILGVKNALQKKNGTWTKCKKSDFFVETYKNGTNGVSV